MASLNDVYRVSMLGQLAPTNEPIINTFHYRISVLGAGDERAALGAALDAVGGVAKSLAAISSLSLSWLQWAIQAVKPVGAVLYYSTTTGAGSTAGTYCPSQCSVIFTRKTAIPGRSGRGRLFQGPIPTNAINSTRNDEVNTPYGANLITAMLAVVTSGGWSFTPVLWRRKFGVSQDLVSVTANYVIKTRRSRAEGTRFHRRRRHTVGSI